MSEIISKPYTKAGEDSWDRIFNTSICKKCADQYCECHDIIASCAYFKEKC